MQVQLLFEQEPLPYQLVYVGHKGNATTHTHDGHTHTHDAESDHDHDEGEDHHHDEMLQLRTDHKGMVRVPITTEGVWYLRTIHLVTVAEEGLTHESNWATLTFAVGNDDSHDHSHDHDHGEDEHEHEDEFPALWFALASFVLIVGLYFWYNRKS